MQCILKPKAAFTAVSELPLKSVKWAVNNGNSGLDLQVTTSGGAKTLTKFTVKWGCSAGLFLDNEKSMSFFTDFKWLIVSAILLDSPFAYQSD